MRTLLQDLRYGIRALVKSPAFTVVAVLTLALGIGANTAIFQLIDAVRLRTIPVKDPQRLAIVRIADRSWSSGSFYSAYSQLTFPLWEQIRKRQEAFSAIGAWGTDDFNLATGGEVHYAHGMWVSGDFFRTLGVQPVVGRLLSDSDDQPGCGVQGVDISYRFWQRQFGGDASVIGRKLTLNGYPFQIIGVTQPAFYGVVVGQSFDVALPICSEPVINGEDTRLNLRYSWWLASVGRLKPGWTLAQATAQLEAITPAVLQETIPSEHYDAEGVKKYLAYKFAAFPAGTGFSRLREDSGTPLWLLLGISGLVLLIACANLANLMLARAGAREREIAVRLALGASRGRLIRQLLGESLLLAGAGATFGALLAGALSNLLVSFISTPNNPIFLDMAFDWRMLGFTAGLAALTTILFGLTPAWRATAMAPSAVLKTGGRGMTASRERFGIRRILVTAQVALSFVLLVSALLFVRSLRNLLTLDAGFQQNGILVAGVDFTRLNIAVDRRTEFGRDLLDKLRRLPGVDAAAQTQIVPLGGWSSNNTVLGPAGEKLKNTWISRVGPGYFQTLETPLLAGRDFDARDTFTSPKVAIVNQAFVKQFLNGADPLGKTFRLQARPGKPVPLYEIVGLAKNGKYRDLHEEFLPTAYFPISQDEHPELSTFFLIRSGNSLPALLAALSSTIAAVSPQIDIDFRVFKTQIHESLLQDELMAVLSGFFGFLAALLAAIGLYGVISYGVSQRTNEIGIRMALGAQQRDVLNLILREAAILLAVGLAVGCALALASARAASSLLFGLKARDPLTLAIALVTLSAVAALASFLPAYRASRLDPMAALHYE